MVDIRNLQKIENSLYDTLNQLFLDYHISIEYKHKILQLEDFQLSEAKDYKKDYDERIENIIRLGGKKISTLINLIRNDEDEIVEKMKSVE